MPKYSLQPLSDQEASVLLPQTERKLAPTTNQEAQGDIYRKSRYKLEPIAEDQLGSLLPEELTPKVKKEPLNPKYGIPADLNKEPILRSPKATTWKEPSIRADTSEPKTPDEMAASGEFLNQMDKVKLPKPDYEKKRELLDKLLLKAPSALVTASNPAAGLIFEGIQQLKNIGVSLKNNTEYSPLESKQIFSQEGILPESTPEWLSISLGVAETLGDIALMAKVQDWGSRGLFGKTLETVGNKLIERGYPKERVNEFLGNLRESTAGKGTGDIGKEAQRLIKAKEYNPPAIVEKPAISMESQPPQPEVQITQPPIVPSSNPPSPSYMQSLESKLGPQAQFYVPGKGDQVGTTRLGLIAKGMSDVLGTTPEAIVDSMVRAQSVASQAVPQEGQEIPQEAVKLAQEQANREFLKGIPIESVVTKMGLFASDPQAREQFVDGLKQGKQEMVDAFMGPIIESNPELNGLFPVVEKIEPERTPLGYIKTNDPAILTLGEDFDGFKIPEKVEPSPAQQKIAPSAEQAPTAKTEPKEMIRIYRGEGEGDFGKDWYTTDRKIAEFYQTKKGNKPLSYIDITPDELKELQVDNPDPTTFQVGPELKSRAQVEPIESKPKEPWEMTKEEYVSRRQEQIDKAEEGEWTDIGNGMKKREGIMGNGERFQEVKMSNGAKIRRWLDAKDINGDPAIDMEGDLSQIKQIVNMENFTLNPEGVKKVFSEVFGKQQSQPSSKLLPKPTSEQAGPVKPKEPWEMSQQEYAVGRADEKLAELESSPNFIPYEHDWQKNATHQELMRVARKIHNNIVREAVKQGKPVPPEVLADYPDLVKQSPAQKLLPKKYGKQPLSAGKKKTGNVRRLKKLSMPMHNLVRRMGGIDPTTSDIRELGDKSLIGHKKIMGKGEILVDGPGKWISEVADRAIEMGLLPKGSGGDEVIEMLRNEKLGKVSYGLDDMPDELMEQQLRESEDRELGEISRAVPMNPERIGINNDFMPSGVGTRIEFVGEDKKIHVGIIDKVYKNGSIDVSDDPDFKLKKDEKIDVLNVTPKEMLPDEQPEQPIEQFEISDLPARNVSPNELPGPKAPQVEQRNLLDGFTPDTQEELISTSKAKPDPLIEEAKKYATVEEFVKLFYKEKIPNQIYQPKGIEDAIKLREEGGSLSGYDKQSKMEWLGGKQSTEKITLYRATPKGGSIVPGDYVTNDLQYAIQHIKNNLGGKGKISKIEATLDDIFPADGPKEFWFAPKWIEQIQTKSQLINIWNKAHGKSEPSGPGIKLSANPVSSIADTLKQTVEDIKKKVVNAEANYGVGELGVEHQDILDSLSTLNISKELLANGASKLRNLVRSLSMIQNLLYDNASTKSIAEGVIDNHVQHLHNINITQEYEKILNQAEHPEALARLMVLADNDNSINIHAEIAKMVKEGVLSQKDKDAYENGFYPLRKMLQDTIIEKLLSSQFGVRMKSGGVKVFVSYTLKSGKAKSGWISLGKLIGLQRAGTKVNIIKYGEQFIITRRIMDTGEYITRKFMEDSPGTVDLPTPKQRELMDASARKKYLKPEEKKLIDEVLTNKNWIPHNRDRGDYWVNVKTTQAVDGKVSEKIVFSTRVFTKEYADKMASKIKAENPDMEVSVNKHDTRETDKPPLGSLIDIVMFLHKAGIDLESEQGQSILNAYRSLSGTMSHLMHRKGTPGYRIDFKGISEGIASAAQSANGMNYRSSMMDLKLNLKDVKDPFLHRTAKAYLESLSSVSKKDTTMDKILSAGKTMTYFWLLANKGTKMVQDLSEIFWVAARSNISYFSMMRPLSSEEQAMVRKAEKEGVLKPMFNEEYTGNALGRLSFLDRQTEAWSSRKSFEVGLKIAKSKGLKGDEAYRFAYQFLFNTAKPFYATANTQAFAAGKSWEKVAQYGYVLTKWLFDWWDKFFRMPLSNKLKTLITWAILGGVGTIPLGRKALKKTGLVNTEKPIQSLTMFERMMLGGIIGAFGVSPKFIVPDITGSAGRLESLVSGVGSIFKPLTIIKDQMNRANREYNKYGIIGGMSNLPLAGLQYVLSGGIKATHGFKDKGNVFYKPKTTWSKATTAFGFQPFPVAEHYERKNDSKLKTGGLTLPKLKALASLRLK